METNRKHRLLIVFYVSILAILLLSVSATPLLIRHGIPLTHRIVIEEETFETALILALFGVSALILRSFMHTLASYRREVIRTGMEKSRLVSRLAEAFNYIGTVNVEIQEVAAVLCGPGGYPRSKKEFRRHVGSMATKAMVIAAAPWLVVRMIDRRSGQTVSEHAVQRPGKVLPSVTIGNRTILDGGDTGELQAIGTRQRQVDPLTVFILPRTTVSAERLILLTAILNQIEMLFMLHRAGCFRPETSTAAAQ